MARLLTRSSSKASLQRAVLLAATIIGLIILPWAVESPYLIHLFIMVFVGTVLGMVFNLFFSAGLITLGCAAFYAIGAYASALLTMNLAISFWLALPLATVITGIVGLALGAAIVRHPGAAFVVNTLVLNLVIVQALGKLPGLGGWGGILGIPGPTPLSFPFLGRVEFTGKIPYYYLMLALMLLSMIAFHLLYRSRVGRAWKAIKLSPQLAETLGINLYRYRLLTFIIASLTTGALGSFYAHYFQTIVPDAFGVWTSISIQMYSVLGGLEFYLLGPVFGSIAMTFFPEVFRVAKEVEPLITGALLVIIILFFPGGFLGTFQMLFSRKGASGQPMGLAGLMRLKRLKSIGKSLWRSLKLGT